MDQNGINSQLLEATTIYNNEHILFQAKQLIDQDLNKYYIENVCYKENSTIPIIEESAKLKIANIFYLNGKRVIIKDNTEIIMEVRKK